MRYSHTIPALLMLLALPVRAQVTVDLNALEQLKKPAPGSDAGKPKALKPAAKPVVKPIAKPSGAPKPPPVAVVAPPALPVAPPPDVALAPLAPPVTPANKSASKSAPPALPVVANAPGAGHAFPGGMRIIFGRLRGELSPASEQSIRLLVGEAPKNGTVSYNVLAYAPGTAEDPSTARRLSLARALAVRSVLMSAGVASTRIYVRALGAAAGSATPDRVDVSVLGANAPPPDLALPPPPDLPPEISMPLPGAAKTP